MQSPYLNLPQQLLHKLGQAILKGQYQVGDRLPSEAGLCSEYNISRTATREAVKMLTAKGLISSRPRQGIKVLESKYWNFFDVDVLSWILNGQPNLYMLRHFQQLRLPIESEAAYLAGEYAEYDDLQDIEKALARMKSATTGQDDSHEADIEFHQSILAASKNPFYIQLKNFIRTALQVNLRFTNRSQGVTLEEYQAHVEIFNHIKNGNSEAAAKCALITQRATLAIVNQKIKALEKAEKEAVSL